jgi:hypothetical protein
MGPIDNKDTQSRTRQQHSSRGACDAGSDNDDVEGHDLFLL